ncbi:MAG: SpoIIE family protein phosphatase [Planctomycetota bacterium]|nr:SpoIIE family protein phosphatase [Planctomycetota bacterium]
MAFLRATNGTNIGKEFELFSKSTLLGRHPSCEVIVQDNAVSRRHAKIENEDGIYFLCDLQSRNGTQVNGEIVQQRHKLNHNDLIQVCDSVFSFYLHRDSASQTRMGGDIQGNPTKVIAEFVDDVGASASSIRRKVDLESSYIHKDRIFARSKLQTMIEITRALSQTLALDEVIPTVLESLFSIFPQADRSFVVLCEPDGELGRHWVKDRNDRETTLRVSRTIIKEAIQSKEAFISQDAFSDQRFDMSKSIAGFSIRSVMCAPMLDTAGNAIGCLQIDTLDPRNQFEQEELDLLATVAMQAGISVENARFHEEALQQRAIDRDLELAREVQLGLLPKEPPKIDGYAFYDFYEAANRVGGDFFDYIELPDGKFAAVVADVAGHGIASAMLMAKFSAEVRFALAREKSASDAVRRLNNAIIRLNLQRFITMILAVIDPVQNTMTLVNAGHLDPIIRDPEGIKQISREIAGLPVGINEDFEYQEMNYPICPKTTVLFYTDGINESMNSEGTQFGHQRIKDTILQCDNTPLEIGNTLIEAITNFEDASVDNDDTCLVCIGRH